MKLGVFQQSKIMDGKMEENHMGAYCLIFLELHKSGKLEKKLRLSDKLLLQLEADAPWIIGATLESQ